jgi:excisionase family DNA binding protein
MMAGAFEPIRVEPSADERVAVRQVVAFLGRHSGATVALVGRGGETVDVPATVARVLEPVVRGLADGRGIAVVPIDAELTSQQAAELLNMSRPSLIRLLDEGKLPYTTTGTHRRIRLGDVLRYREQRTEARRQAHERLHEFPEQIGSYDREFADAKVAADCGLVPSADTSSDA